MFSSFSISLLLIIDLPIWVSEDSSLVINKWHLSVFSFIWFSENHFKGQLVNILQILYIYIYIYIYIVYIYIYW